MRTQAMQEPSTDHLAKEAYSPGLDGVIAGESALCLVDEGEAGLRYRGYAVSELAEQSSFEDVAYLLLYGQLPTTQALDGFTAALKEAQRLPSGVDSFLAHRPSGADAMDVLRTAVSLLGLEESSQVEDLHERNLGKAVRVLAQMPLMLSYLRRDGRAVRSPRDAAGFAEQLLCRVTGRDPGEHTSRMARVLDISLILYAEHEFNASTFAARVVASTLTDLHGAITAAIAALKGPLHGGANEAVVAMLTEIGTSERAEAWVRAALSQKRRIMGFGHRVLKHGDARSDIIRRHAEVLSRSCGETRWFDIATIVERLMRDEKGLYPNLDFYTAVAYLLMGIPRELCTPIFVCSRMSGWCAHIIEQQDHNRLIRPRARYTGPLPQPYVPIDRRR